MNEEVKPEETVEVPVKKESVKETKDALALVFVLGKLLKLAKENDGVITTADLALLAGAVPVMGPAFEGIDKVVAEMKDLDMDELKELLVYSAAHLGGALDSDELKEKIEKGLAAVLALIDFYRVMK